VLQTNSGAGNGGVRGRQDTDAVALQKLTEDLVLGLDLLGASAELSSIEVLRLDQREVANLHGSSSEKELNEIAWSREARNHIYNA
jgi:hypothetical protein